MATGDPGSLTATQPLTIPARFARQVARHGAKRALKTASRQLSYADLDAITSRLAARLDAAGTQAAKPVGLLMDQMHIAASMLGVTKAGRFYVPLEPSDPPEAIHSVIADAGISTLITDAGCRELTHRIAGDKTAVLDLEIDAADAVKSSPVGSHSETDLACILYTSGSTGKPKGVMFDHRCILHIVDGNTRSLNITSSDRIALVSSNAFIGTTATVFRTLLNGATLLPFDPRGASPTDFAEWLEKEEITLIQMVPTLFRHLAGALKQKPRALSLRLIHLAGEVVDQQDLGLFDSCFTHCEQFINEAGATETGAFSRLNFRHGERPETHVVPVGPATEDKEIVLLGPDEKPRTHGKIGKIAIQSRFLARGYWQREAETAKRFLRVPDKAGYRQFLTGDLGVMDDQGCLTIAGRTDSQIKLRGRRIDLTDLESRLRSETGSQGAAVTVVQQAGGDPKLVAYLETHDSELSGEELRLKLRRCLPGYMVPEVFVVLKHFPLTATGKIDRRNLPAPPCEPAEANKYVAPASDVEVALAEFWAQELGLPQVGVKDDFLQLGGESLFVGKAISHIQRLWSVHITFGEFFDLRTISELARVVETRSAELT